MWMDDEETVRQEFNLILPPHQCFEVPWKDLTVKKKIKTYNITPYKLDEISLVFFFKLRF